MGFCGNLRSLCGVAVEARLASLESHRPPPYTSHDINSRCFRDIFLDWPFYANTLVMKSQKSWGVQMARANFPTAAVIVIAVCLGAWWQYNNKEEPKTAQVGAQAQAILEANAHLNQDTKMPSRAVGFVFLDDAKTYHKLLLAQDYKAMSKLVGDRNLLDQMADIDAGQRVAVEKKMPDPSNGRWYCIRPFGEPNCYWFHGMELFGDGW